MVPSRRRVHLKQLNFPSSKLFFVVRIKRNGGDQISKTSPYRALRVFRFLPSKMYDVARKWRCDGVRDNSLGHKNLSPFAVYFDVLTFGDRLAHWKAFLAFLLTIKVEYKCHDGVILNSIRLWSFATKITKDTSIQTDAIDGFVLGLLEGPPLQIRNYVVIIRSSDAICEIWLVQKTIAFVHCEWPFFRSLFFRFSQKFAYSCNNSYSNTTSDVQ